MRVFVMCCLATTILASSGGVSFAAAPKALSEVAAAEDLVKIADETIGKLGEAVADQEKFAKAQSDHSLAQSAGLLACLAQALAEHDGKAAGDVAAPALRDAAIALRDAKSYSDAQSAFEAVQTARAGKADSEAAKEHPWNKLINLHRLMEEVNARNSSLRRSARRIRKPEEDSRDAATLAVLALAIHADTHEVKNPADVGEWQKLSLEYSSAMTDLAGQMKKGDSDAAYSTWRNAQKTCQACHEKFKEE